jgi:hypothetical protein
MSKIDDEKGVYGVADGPTVQVMAASDAEDPHVDVHTKICTRTSASVADGQTTA